MKSAFFLLFTALVFFNACNGGANTTSSESSDSTDGTASTGFFYKRFEGTVAGQPVVLHWHQYDNYGYGIYYYQKQGRKIELYNWEDTVTDDADFYLTERSVTEMPGEVDPHWLVSFTDNKVTGKWLSNDNTKSFPIELKEVYPAASYPFSLVYVVDSATLLEGKDEPKAISTYLSVIPAKPIPGNSQAFVLSLIKQAWGCNEAVADIQDCIQHNNRTYFEGYRKEALDMDTSGISSPDFSSPSFNYTSDRNILIVHNDNDLLVLEDFTRDFSGGAHGNYSSSFLNLDLEDQKLLKLADVIKSSDTLKVLSVLQEQARSYLKLKPDEPLSSYLFEDAIPLTDNFFLTGTGITFVYNPYEIAAYAAGQINIFVPFSSIKDLLTPSFRQMVKM